jgi:hypothetical protein
VVLHNLVMREQVVRVAVEMAHDFLKVPREPQTVVVVVAVVVVLAALPSSLSLRVVVVLELLLLKSSVNCLLWSNYGKNISTIWHRHCYAFIASWRNMGN